MNKIELLDNGIMNKFYSLASVSLSQFEDTFKY